MKGLLLKDLYMSRKTFWVYLLMMVVFAVVQSTTGVVFALFYAIMIPVNLIALDERDHFDSLLPMLPVGGVATVLDKYVISWCMMGIGVVFYFVRCLFPDAQFEPGMLLVGIGICMVSQAISLPLIYKFGVERGRMIYLVAIIAQASLLGALGSIWENYLAQIAPMLTAVLMLAAGAALSAGSVVVSSRVYLARITA